MGVDEEKEVFFSFWSTDVFKNNHWIEDLLRKVEASRETFGLVKCEEMRM